jgi:sigma-B regulation protein RsbU (phosphoserine phosphatase)
MESSAAKLQTIPGETMAATAGNTYLGTELERRRERLLAASQLTGDDPGIRSLLSSVDAALDRLQKGTFGICEVCHESIEPERLLCDPLVRVCLDHLSHDEQRALEHDLSLAASMQRGLLPRQDWSVKNWLARYHYQPASLVSGDYCDLIEIESDGAFLFLLGDVAGKGVAASMLMSHLHATFRALAGQNLPLQTMVAHANRLFCESTTAGQFATLIVGRAWPDGKVEYASAGHLPLLHVSSNGVSSKEATGMPLGMFCGSEFPVCHLDLAAGDSLILYTDGLTEIFNDAGDEYGINRVRTLATTFCCENPDEMLAGYLEAVREFSHATKRADDMTLLVLRRTN